MKTHAQPPPPKAHARTILALFALLTILGITACEPRVDKSSSENTSDNVQPHNVVTIKGSLDPAVGNIAHARVIAFRVQSDGTLQDISVGDFQTDGQGRFEVLANVEKQPLSNVIIEARTPAQTASDNKSNEQNAKMPTRLASTLLLNQLKRGEVISTAPLDFETTLEADIYLQAHKLGQWDPALCDEAQLRIAVTPQLATALRTGEDYDAQVAILARAITTGMRAFTTTLLRDPAFEDKTTTEGRHEIEPGFRREGIRKAFSPKNIEKARQDFRNEVEKYDRRTDNRNPDVRNDRTQRALRNALLQSYLDNDINIHVLVRANQAASEATLAAASKLAPPARAATTANLERQRARFITNAIQSDFSMLGGSGESSKAVEQAGVTLRNSLADLADRTDDITPDVHSLWQQYRQRVEEKLQTTFTAQQRLVVEQMQSDIVPATRTLFNTLENLSPDTTSEDTASTAADAVLLFHKDTTPLAYSELWKDADINSNRATAILDILLNFATIR